MIPYVYVIDPLTNQNTTVRYDHLVKSLAAPGNRPFHLSHGAMGITSEAGEVADWIKKHVIYGQELNVRELKKELGDVLWYLHLILLELGSDPQEIYQMNADKLSARYSSLKFSTQESKERKDEQR